MEYAIIDIETTGGSCVYHKIIEIAVLVHDGTKVIERYQTLVNPGQNILDQVTLIHGITDAMVVSAPTFIEIAPELLRLTENRVFVAHSVNFDYSLYAKNTKILVSTLIGKNCVPCDCHANC